MKVKIVNEKSEYNLFTARDLPIGLAIMKVGSAGSPYLGEVFLRAYDVLVLLSKPNKTWSLDVTGWLFEPLADGEQVLLTQESK